MATKRSSKATFWWRHVTKYKASGQSRAEYCREHRLKIHQLAYHVRQLNKQVGRDQNPFAKVKVADTPSVHRSAAARLVLVNGVAVEFENGADPAWIARLVAAVGGGQ